MSLVNLLRSSSVFWFKANMALIDRQGRLLGKVSLIDLGAIVVVVVAIAAVFFFPGSQSGSVAQIGSRPNQPVEVDMIARGISARSVDDLFQPGTKANIIIRNQPYGEVDVVRVEDVTKAVPVALPDGSIEMVRDETYRADIVVTLAGLGRLTDDGVVLGNNKVKVGVPLELETFEYFLRGSVMEVRLLDSAS